MFVTFDVEASSSRRAWSRPISPQPPSRYRGTLDAAATDVYGPLFTRAREVTAVLHLDSAAAFTWASQLPVGCDVTLVVRTDDPAVRSAIGSGDLVRLLRDVPRAGVGEGAAEVGRARLSYAAENGALRVLQTEEPLLDELIEVRTPGVSHVVERSRAEGVDSERVNIFNEAQDAERIASLREEIHALVRDGRGVGLLGDRSGREELREYQTEAIAAWRRADARGILAMATGTGKTLTAMEALEELAAEVSPLATVVIAPLRHLVDQWADRFAARGTRAIRCHTNSAKWEPEASRDIDLLRAGVRDRVTLVATYASFDLDEFRDLLARIPEDRFALVVDEAHNAGSGSVHANLPSARFRLGLTATPERWGDPAGTQRLEDYFGGVAFSYTLADAIEDDVLAPYRYVLHGFGLADDELREFTAASAVYAELLTRERRDPVEVERARRRRAEVLDAAAGKVELLRRALREERPDRTVVYCSGRKQLDAALSLCWEEGFRALPFTGEETATERRETLVRFASGDAPVLGAIRCLDEGVDIPEAREAYLLKSSGNPAQYVQRRGRLLRRAPGKDEAVIHDVIARNGPPELVEMESERVREFASAATNGDESLGEFERIVGGER